MSVTVSAIVGPEGRKSRSGFLVRRLVAGIRSIRRYLRRRAAIAWLLEADACSLRDIGLERSQIEAAVRGGRLDAGRERTR